MIDQLPVPVLDAVLTLCAGYVSWQAHQVRSWIKSHEERTEANEVRSHYNREVLSEAGHDTDNLPPADDPAAGEFATDGGEAQ